MTPPRNVVPQTPASIQWRRLLVRLVAKGAIAPSALRPSGPSRAFCGLAPTGAPGAALSPSGGGVHFLEATRSVEAAGGTSRDTAPVPARRGVPNPSPSGDPAG